MKYQILSSLSVLFVSVTAAPVFASSTSPTVGNTTVDVLLKQQEQLGWTEHNSTSFTPAPVCKGVREQLSPQTHKTGTRSFFLEFVKHYPTWKIGLLLAVPSVLSGLIAPFAGLLSDRFGSRQISLIGLVLMVSGCLAISTFNIQVSELGYILRYAPLGFGLGFFQSPNNSSVMGAVPRERLGIASGLLSLSRTSGTSVGVPLLGAVFSALSGGLASDSGVVAVPETAIVVGVQGTFHLAAFILFVAAATAVVAWRMERRHS